MAIDVTILNANMREAIDILQTDRANGMRRILQNSSLIDRVRIDEADIDVKE